MSLPNQQPTYLRYLKSQLLNLKRPSFWGTAIFLCLVGVIIRQYWENPTNIFAVSQEQDKPIVTQQPENAGLTEEERADFADIDNLPVFLNDYEQGIISIVPTASSAQKQNQKSENFLEEVIKKQNSANEAKSKANLALTKNSTVINTKNPFVLQAQGLLQPEVSSGSSQFLGYRYFNNSSNQTTETVNSSPFGVGLTNQNRQTQNTGFASPLGSAVNQSSNQSFPSLTRDITNSTINPYPSTNQNWSSFTNTNTTTTSTVNNAFDGRTTLTNNQTLPGRTGMEYVDPSITKPLQNSSGSLNNNQNFPNQVTPITGVAPVTNTLPNSNYPNNNYSWQNQGQAAINSPNPAYGNYGSSGLPQSNYGNYGVQQPTRLPQSNYGNYGVQQPSQLPQSYGNPGWQQPGQLPSNTTYPGQPEQYYNSYPQNYPR